MHLFSEITKAMIRHDQIAVFATPGCNLVIYITHKLVESFVPILNNIHSVVKEHMLNPVKVIKYAGKDTFTKFIHQIVKYLNPAFEDHFTQVKKLLIADTAFFQPGRILRPAKSQIGADFFPKFLRERVR